MARKIAQAPPDDAQADAAGDALAVLHPERNLTLGGRGVTIREYGFFEGLEIADRAAGFIDDLIAMSEVGPLRYAQVRRLFGRHRSVIPVIAAQAGDVEVVWLDALADDELELYLATWFAVNAAFFVREVLAELRERRLLQAAAQGTLTGPASSSASPPPDSATSPGSVA